MASACTEQGLGLQGPPLPHPGHREEGKPVFGDRTEPCKVRQRCGHIRCGPRERSKDSGCWWLPRSPSAPGGGFSGAEQAGAVLSAPHTQPLSRWGPPSVPAELKQASTSGQLPPRPLLALCPSLCAQDSPPLPGRVLLGSHLITHADSVSSSPSAPTKPTLCEGPGRQGQKGDHSVSPPP